MNLACRAFLAAILPVLLSACSADGSQASVAAQRIGDARVRLDPSGQDLVCVDLVNTRGQDGYDFERHGGRERLVIAMLAVQFGALRIVETRETRTGNAGRRQLRLCTITVACPTGASRVVAS